MKDRFAERPSGIRFPSIRDVMREFNVSQFTVDKAMTLLAKDGLVVRDPKRGVFTTSRDKTNTRKKMHTLAIAVPSYPSSVYELYITELSSQVRRIGEVVKVIRYDWRDRIVQSLPQKEVDALILIPTSCRLTPADFYGLSQFKIPVVLISRTIRDVAIDCVEPDNVMGAELAAEHLISLGHKKLSILLAEPEGVSSESRIDGFTRKAKLLGIENISLMDSQTKPGENSAMNAYEFLKNKIKTDGLDFTGLFVLSDMTALGAMRALHDLKISIPGQVSGVGFGDDPESPLYHPSLTTVGTNYRLVAKEAVDIIELRLSGDKEEVIQTFIPMTLVKRESTGNVPA